MTLTKDRVVPLGVYLADERKLFATAAGVGIKRNLADDSELFDLTDPHLEATRLMR